MTQAQARASTSSRLSRRDFLSAAVVGGGAIATIGVATSPAEAAKMSQKAMSYKPSPNGSQRCDSCANFQAPNACKVVDGAIAPNGWCILYRAK